MKEEILYSRYLKIFYRCISSDKFLTLKEISSMAKKDEKNLSKNYFSNLKKFGLIITLPKCDLNKKSMELFHKKKWETNTRGSYYYFTKETSKIKRSLDKIMLRFGDTLNNRKDVLLKVDELLCSLSLYECLSSAKLKDNFSERLKRVITMSDGGRSKKEVAKYLKESESGLLNRTKSEEALKRLFNPHLIIKNEKSSIKFEKLYKMIINFVITGNTEGRIDDKTTMISAYPIMLERVFNLKFQTEEFLKFLQESIDLEKLVDL